MKKLFLIIFLLLFSIAFSQNNKMSDLVIVALKKSKDTTDVSNIKKILANDYNTYRAFFNYIPSINPLNPKKQKRFSSKFGRRFHPIDGKYKQHLGLDVSANIGTPIHAAASGIVEKTIISNYGYGNNITIKHEFGYSTRYCHLHTFIVKKGFKVKKGDIIGFVGNTGKSTAPHLHFEIKKNNKHLDPFPFCFLNL